LWAGQMEEEMCPDSRRAVTALLGKLAAALEVSQERNCQQTCDHRTAEQFSQAGAAS
jgi:hypothetical protein